MTAELEGGECSAARSGRTFPPGKIRYQFYKRLGEPQDRPGRAENFFHTGIRSRTVQPIVSRLPTELPGPQYFFPPKNNSFFGYCVEGGLIKKLVHEWGKRGVCKFKDWFKRNSFT